MFFYSYLRSGICTDQSEEKVEEFDSQIENLFKKLPSKEILILMGDFNAKIDKAK